MFIYSCFGRYLFVAQICILLVHEHHGCFQKMPLCFSSRHALQLANRFWLGCSHSMLRTACIKEGLVRAITQEDYRRGAGGLWNEGRVMANKVEV